MIQQHSSFVQTDFIKPQRLMQTSVGQELNDHFHKEPAIMMTGQHHAREIVTNQMVLFALLKMIHGGIVHNEPKFMKLLE